MFDINKNYYWENALNGRYYIARFQKDLLGDTVIMAYWGTERTRLGGTKTWVVPQIENVQKMMERLHKIRCKHGYKEVKNLN
jgi:hypothetical protein